MYAIPSWQKLISHTAYIVLASRSWKRKKIVSNKSLPLALNTDILDDGKNKILALVKQGAFTSELHNLRLQLPLAKHSKFYHYNPF